MPRHCTICNHPRLREITGDLMARPPYRSIQSRYGISKSALERHVSRHVTKALRKLTAADMKIAMAAEIGEPVLVEMRKLNARSLWILKAAEDAKDHELNAPPLGPFCHYIKRGTGRRKMLIARHRADLGLWQLGLFFIG